TIQDHSGVVFDLRGCTGGSVRLAERLLRRVAGGRIDPVTAQVRNTVGNERFCRARAGVDERYRLWGRSIRRRMAEGQLYSEAQPFSHDEDVGDRVFRSGRIPSLVIVDRNTASAGEVFAAGFQDNSLGEVIGTHASTSGACAHSVRLSHLLMARVNNLDYPFDRESEIGRLRFAIARIGRGGLRAGTPIEGRGVRPDRVVPLTRNDVLNRNQDLLLTAARRLVVSAPASSGSGRSLPPTAL
ncbi:MAG: S41 family peptidase, partial [Pseudomonadota bacterium]